MDKSHFPPWCVLRDAKRAAKSPARKPRFIANDVTP
jgi:hypothetical protein